MKVLGVHDGHTATSALLEDGEIKAAISEERLNRIKEWQGLPKESVKRVLEITKTQPNEIDLVVFSSIIQQIEREQYTGDKSSIGVLGFNIHGYPLVHSPKDAIETLIKSDLKYLAMENYLIEKK